MNANKRSAAGFTLIEIMIVVCIIGMLAAISIPNFIRARSRSQTNVCINNLRQIDAAKQQWAAELRKEGTAVPERSDLDPYVGRTGHADNVVCPAGGAGATFTSSYTIKSVSETPVCNIVPTGKDAHVLPVDDDQAGPPPQP
jgi:prepilin-type N-terminal cleavage/methylation domain-containing protein